MSIVNDNITEDAETFRALLTLENDDQADLVTVTPDEAIVTIDDNDGRQYLCCILSKYCMLLCWISRFITTRGMQYSMGPQDEWNIAILGGSNKPDIQHSSMQYLFHYIPMRLHTNPVRALKTETMHSSKTTLVINKRK